MLTSPRLRLVLLSPAAYAQLASGSAELAAAELGAPLPVDWIVSLPWRHWSSLITASADCHPWLARIMVSSESGEIVGNAGFFGPPVSGVVELGYAVVPSFRRRGFASEAVRALVEWAVLQPGVTMVTARISPENAASISVVRRLGFEPTGTFSHDDEHGEVQLWQRHDRDAASGQGGHS